MKTFLGVSVFSASRASIAIVGAIAAIVAASETASAGVIIYDWRTPGGPFGVLDPRHLGERRVIELNSEELSVSLPILRLGTETRSGSTSRYQRDGRVRCMASRSMEPTPLEQARAFARGQTQDDGEVRLAADAGALINEDTVVICRPPERPSQTFQQARIRTCTYQVEGPSWAHWWGLYTERFDLVLSQPDGSIASLRPGESVMLNTAYGPNDDDRARALASGCPEMRLQGIDAMPVYSVMLQATWRSFQLDGLVGDRRPRSVLEAVEAINAGGDARLSVLFEAQMEVDRANSESAAARRRP